MSLEIPSGSITIMNMTTPPPGWVKVTTSTFNLSALRVVSGSASSGGSVNYTSVFDTLSASVSSSSITVEATTTPLLVMPDHTHNYNRTHANTIAASAFGSTGGSGHYGSLTASAGNLTTPPIGPGNSSHAHPVTAPVSSISGQLDVRVKYVDVILVQRS